MKVDPKSWRKIKHGVFLPKECNIYNPSGDLQRTGNDLIIKVARRANLPLLMTLDSHFVYSEQKMIQDIALQNGKDETSGMKFSTSYNMLNTQEAWDQWSSFYYDDLPTASKVFTEAVENNHVLASMCTPIKLDNRFRLPDVHIPESFEYTSEEKKQEEYVRHLINIYGRMPCNQVYRDRVELELRVIADNGKVNLLPYFLTLHDICRIAEDIGIIVGPGRGSAGGCLVAYLLKITHRDPIPYGLMFERFLSDGRIERGKLPDIDMDFSEPDRLAHALKDVYGDKIVRICTTGTTGVKSAIHDISRVLLDTKNNSTTKEEVKAVCKSVSIVPQGTENLKKWLEGYEDSDGNFVDGEINRNTLLNDFFISHPTVKDCVMQILGIPRNIGRHAAAYCIADEPVHTLVPLCSVKGEICTQFTMGPVEKMGLVKFDMLGLNTLKDINGCIDIIRDRTGNQLDMYNIPEDDAAVYQDFCDGLTASIFQFNGPIPTSVCKKIRPSSMLDLSAITAACRPGTLYAKLECGIDVHGDPIMKTFIQSWIDRRTGDETITYLHPSLEPILRDTQGIFIYQEQINKMLITCCGYTADKADEIREIIGKKKADKMALIVPDIKQRLIDNGWSVASSDAIIALCIAASSYVFNLSHSVNYAYIGYVCMYLKHHYPIEWWTAILRNSTHKDLELNAEHFNRYLMLPDINKSDIDFYIIDNECNKIVYPLSMVKGVKNASKNIVENKPFPSFSDFYGKITKRIVNKGVVNALIFAGAFDRMEEVKDIKHSWTKRNILLRLYASLRKEPEPEPMDKATILMKEASALSIGDVDVYELWRLYIESLAVNEVRMPRWFSSVVDIKEINTETLEPKTPISIVGLIKALKVIKTKKGDDMCFVTLASSERSISVTLFPDMYKATTQDQLCVVGNFMAVKGISDSFNDRVSIIANQVDIIEATLL